MLELMQDYVPSGKELIKLPREEQLKWLKFVLSNSYKLEDILKLRSALKEDNEMVVIKLKEKSLKKPVPSAVVRMSAKSKKKLKRPQDNQPVPTVAV